MNEEYINSRSNYLKKKSGDDHFNSIKTLLQILKDNSIINNFQTEQNYSHIGYQYSKQYLANFVIETINNKYIIVRSSNSFRSDRAKIGFYDLDGIKNHSKFSNDILSSIYLVPDSEGYSKEFKSIRKKLQNKEYYSPANYFFTITEFKEYLEEYKLGITSKYLIEQSINNEYCENELRTIAAEKGRQLSIRGIVKEKEITSIINSKENFLNYRNEKANQNNTFKIIINKILEQNKDLKVEDIILIEATDTVPLLRSGGPAKSDVIIKIQTPTKTYLETLSIKNSDKTKVTCHEYNADTFVRVLGCEHTKLEFYLHLFQRYGNYNDFEKNLPQYHSVSEFKALLLEKSDRFCNWVLSGRYDIDNLTNPEKQISKYIYISINPREKIYSMDEFIKNLSAKRTKEKFGVPFSWTYPSNKRGEKIQLKVSIDF